MLLKKVGRDDDTSHNSNYYSYSPKNEYLKLEKVANPVSQDPHLWRLWETKWMWSKSRDSQYLKNDICDERDEIKSLVLAPIKLGHHHKQVGPGEHGAVKNLGSNLFHLKMFSYHSAIFLCALRTEFSMSIGWYLMPRKISVSSRAPTTNTASWCSEKKRINNKMRLESWPGHTSIAANGFSPPKESQIASSCICLYRVAACHKPGGSRVMLINGGQE